MRYLLAALPILAVLTLMILLRWSGQRAGLAGWLTGCLVGALAFGLTPQVWWVSQARGLYLSFFVLAVLWPALLLYKVVDQIGGIQAIACGLQGAVREHGLLLLLLAWAFSSMLEGLAGFGLPVAIVAPMLAGLGINPVLAVAAVAVGHAWSVTFGDMGVIFSTLVAIVNLDPASLAPLTALILGLACLGCGLATARLLGQGKLWPQVMLLAVWMAAVQYILATGGLAPLASFGAGLAGIAGSILLSRIRKPAKQASIPAAEPKKLIATLGSYAGLTLLMAAIYLVAPLNHLLAQVRLSLDYPEVATAWGWALAGWITPAGSQVFRPLTHPGSSILLVAVLSYLIYRRLGLAQPADLRKAAAATWRMAGPSSLGIIAMVGLSTLMDHCGMTILLAQGLATAMGGAFPVASPLVGMLGAFATGSNNNSNVLLASLQKSVALLLKIDPRLLVATQTAGGSLGSMIAPAKIIVGCNTTGIGGRDGEVLRRTLPYGLLLGLALGLLAWGLAAIQQ